MKKTNKNNNKKRCPFGNIYLFVCFFVCLSFSSYTESRGNDTSRAWESPHALHPLPQIAFPNCSCLWSTSSNVGLTNKSNNNFECLPLIFPSHTGSQGNSTLAAPGKVHMRSSPSLRMLSQNVHAFEASCNDHLFYFFFYSFRLTQVVRETQY